MGLEGEGGLRLVVRPDLYLSCQLLKLTFRNTGEGVIIL
jgi:hypothetical protein